ncbi:MAG TPA: rhodanese-like domain-containing protein [Bacteroidia bacterium]|jgi:rhodanese-related sulfurtransferase|nr:rhodanese-like domain-containing protein [Bacteroidia bacterium]
MINTIKRLFGRKQKENFAELVKTGAQIIDVRTKDEFSKGHIIGSINIPLHILKENLSKVKKNTTIITCCASGMRSAAAKKTLKENGYPDVYNGGGWLSLQNKIKSAS